MQVVIATVAVLLLGGQPVPRAGAVEQVGHALRLKRFDEALRLLDPLVYAAPRDARLWTLRGLALDGLGRSRESLEAYDRAVAVAPEYLPALLGKAQVEYTLGEPRAWLTLRKVVALDPGNATAHAMLGSLAFERKQCRDALGHFEKARREIQAEPLALWRFGQCLLLENRPADAAAVFRILVDLQPDDEKPRLNLALCLHEARRYDEASDILRPLTGRPDPSSDALTLAAAVQRSAGRPEKAMAALRRAVELYPREESHYLDLGALCVDYGSRAIGIEILLVGARNIPTSAALRVMLGVLWAQEGSFDEAQAAFDEADRLQPHAGLGAVGLSYSSTQLDAQLDSAIEQLRLRLVENPGDALLNYLLADGLMRKKVQPGDPEFEQAHLALLRSVASKPDFAKARTALGKIYRITEKIPEAIREFEFAVKLDSSDQFATYQLAMALQRAGRTQEARAMVQKLRELKMQERAIEDERARLRVFKEAPGRPR
ncbi:MAG: tetratricopeptide repeat protein [Planctomycetes bacterium]|nr:tetratricopeptide repeat protein [Planctomycetota bacterium]